MAVSTWVSWIIFFFFFSSRRRHTRCSRDWSSDVCSSDLIALTLVRRELEDFDLTLGGLGQRAEQLAAALPGERTRLEQAEREREAGVQARHTAEARRTEVERRLADAKLESGRLEGDLALAAERLRNAGQRRATAAQRREQEEARAL